MMGKIALEEHIALPDTLSDSEQYFTAEAWRRLNHRLIDIHGERLEQMEQHGIDMMLLSLNAPAIQAIAQTALATETARKANDYLAEQVARNPRRFQGLAALALQDPEEAARELTRCVKQLGFRGALVNGFSQIGDQALYYDLPRYESFWATVEQLGVPFYLHPRDPLPAMQSPHYDGHPWFVGSAWAFAVETSIHALRLMGSGLFDRFPKLTIILGHLGERLPYDIWRVDHRLSRTPRDIPAKKTMTEYLRQNFYLTTSGNFRDSTLACALAEVGPERILFSADYPFEDVSEAADWFDRTPLDPAVRSQIAHSNAARLFRLD